jgi:bacterioferritin
MKGQKKVIDALNAGLADELAAVNQYIVHAEMCENWGYGELHDAIKKRAIDEMKHAETLIARLLFLEGRPVVSKLSPIHIGETVPKMMDYDLEAELGAVKSYNAFVKLCVELGDKGSAEVFDHLLQDEERHVDWIEAQKDQIAQMGIQNYLSQKIK